MDKEEYRRILEEAKKISIVSVMDDQGMDYIDMRNFAQGIDHDSLMIDKRKNHFYWNSQIENGKVVNGDVVDFVTRFFGKSHIETLNYLTQESHEKLSQMSVDRQKPKEPFQYYFKHNTGFENARNYLVNERKISGVLVDTLHAKGFIQEDVYKQSVFVWSNIGKATGASVIGSEYNPEKFGKRGRFKGIARNSESNYGFNVTLGTPDSLYVFESPIDLLSYWSLNPNLQNCMLAEMEGLKEQSVYKFINQMYLSKGALPTEGIYLGVDNDSAGQRFFDNLSKLSYVDNETKREVQFKKLIPNDLDIPKANILIYQEAANEYGVDWLAIAATHKALTNFSPEGKISNGWDNQEYFSGDDVDLASDSKKVAEKLQANETASNEYDLPKLFQTQKRFDAIDLTGLHQKVSSYYDDYRNLGYRPTDTLVKDWNDSLRYKVALGIEAKLLEATYQRNEKERMKVIKDQERKKYVAVSMDNQSHEPFFEADSLEEATRLVKNYGFQALDKEDRKKYQPENTPEARQKQNWAMSR